MNKKKVVIIVAIFLYGFIIVIAIIGITNIFNTITTNVALRRGEFASLRSIGMTTKEFNKMIFLNQLWFFASKTILWNIFSSIWDWSKISVHKIGLIHSSFAYL